MKLGSSIAFGQIYKTAAASLPASAPVFDGTNDYMSRMVSGQGNTYRATASFWVRVPTQSSYGIDRVLAIGNVIDLGLNTLPGFGVAIQAQSTGSTALLRIVVNAYDFFNKDLIINASTGFVIARDTWAHVFVAVDTENFIYTCYVDNADAGLTDTAGNTTPIEMGTGAGNNGIGIWNASTPSSQYLNGALYQVWAALDFYDPAIYASQFYNAGDPPLLGANGSALTGSQPLIYLNSEPASFTTNAGSGGNFTLTGALGTIAAP